MASVGINYEDRARNFGHFPELQLFQMASNDSARLEYRRYAVELLLEKGYKSANKPELAALRAEVLKARADAGDPIVPEKASDDRENAAAARLLRLDESLADGQVLNNAAQAEYGALKASVTTASLSQEPEVLQNADAAAENADSGGTSSNAGDNSEPDYTLDEVYRAGNIFETGAAIDFPVQIMEEPSVPQAPEESATETVVQEAAPTSTSNQTQLQPTENQE